MAAAQYNPFSFSSRLHVLCQHAQLLCRLYDRQFSPPPPAFTTRDVSSLSSKVYIVTGGNSGIGKELVQVLYGQSAIVYVLTRDSDKTKAVFNQITASCKPSTEGGELHFIHVELSDLDSVRTAASEFLGKRDRLDGLFLNAGVAHYEDEARKKKGLPTLTKQGFEWHVGVNTLAHFLLQQLLQPVLQQTAESSDRAGSVRVVWPASIMVEQMAPRWGVPTDFLHNPDKYRAIDFNYSISKTVNWYLAAVSARRTAGLDKVVYIAVNPGSYTTSVWRTTPGLIKTMIWWLLRQTEGSSTTYLWAAFSPEVTIADAENGRYGICDGRWHPGQRADLVLGMKKGGTGHADLFYDQCNEAVKPYTKG